MKDLVHPLPAKLATASLAFGIAAVVETFITVEWSYPYCSNPDSGPAFAAMGMPLPYKVYSGISSMEHFFMPHILVLNLLLLALLCHPICRALLIRTRASPRIAAYVGLACMLVAGSVLWLGVASHQLTPVHSISVASFMRYQELRPVSFGFNLANAVECKASRFWF